MQRKRWFLGALLALAIAILALVEWLACWNMLQTQEGDRWVNHTYSVIRNLNGLSDNIKKAEAAQRRFLLTGSEAYLARYRTNLDGIAQQFEDVKVLTDDNPSQHRIVTEIGSSLERHVQQLDHEMSTRHRPGIVASPETVLVEDKVSDLAAHICKQIELVQDNERGLLAARTKAKELHASQTFKEVFLGAILAFGLLFLVLLMLRKEIAQRLRAEAALDQNRAGLEQVVRKRTGQLNETIDELERFSYALTHDLRAPLRAMHGYATLLESPLAGTLSSQGIELVKRLQTASSRMDRLIQDALSYNRSQRQALPLAGVDLARLLQDLSRTYPNLSEDQVRVEILPPLGTVQANELALAQCFANLLQNAVKFVRPGLHPHVRVWVEPRGSFARIFFEDNGIGIDKADQSRVFGMFQRINKSTEGTGVGLAIVKKTVERMGGRVGVESAGRQGSTFWIDLPWAARQAPEEAQSRACAGTPT